MKTTLIISLLMYFATISAQVNQSVSADTLNSYDLEGVSVVGHQTGVMQLSGAQNAVKINQPELFKAACCNLGESFTTNPSVDINYSDATTGAKQIRLLGLSGTYVQMLTENLPNFRIAAAPYALDLVPGPWMESIQVSKGSASVKNGYESITGQIDIEYLKPDDDQGITANLYGNTLGRMEANADANIHLSTDEYQLARLSTELLIHYQEDYGHHDQNHDSFLDQPGTKQWNMQNRWKLRTEQYLMHAGIALTGEKREGGQTHHTAPHVHNPYTIDIETNRYEAYMKHAFIIDPKQGTNIALMANGAIHDLDTRYGIRTYNATQRSVYAQLMFETNFTSVHNLSTGVSINHDYLHQTEGHVRWRETVPGIYVQYTFNLENRFTAMAGIRADHSNQYGTFITPRLHLKYSPYEVVDIRLSAGRGYRTPQPLAENHYLLSSGRTLVINSLEQEDAWNYGVSTSFNIPLAGNTLRFNAEYYHTHFCNQTVIDYDSDPSLISIDNLKGRSYSNTIQVDASYPIVEGLELTAAYRWNDVKTTYGGRLMRRPLTSRYKGLVTLDYKTPLGLWQADITFQLNGPGRLPVPYTTADGTPSWASNYRAFGQLSAQFTRWFRQFSVYLGGENLTAYRQEQIIIGADDPWGSRFEPTMVWGPVHGAVVYAGIRLNLGRM